MRNEKGVTFIEIMISALILSLSLGGMLTTFVMGRISVAKAKHRIEAFNLIQEKVEEIKDASYGNIAVGTVTESNIIIDLGSSASGDELIGTRVTNVTTVTEGKQITVTITWTERKWGGSNQITESIVTIVSQ